MLVGRDGADEADDRRFVEEYPRHAGSAFDLLVDSLQRVGAPDFGPVPTGEREHSVFALSIKGMVFENRPASCPRTSSQLAATVAGSG
jgi:hypothetical protein